MEPFFTQEALKSIQARISGCLKDTFHMMFSLSVSADCEGLNADNRTVSSHIVMRHGASTAYMSVIIGMEVVENLCRQLQPGADTFPPELIQEIAGEITNIVSNNLRTYMSETYGVSFDLTLPQSGSVTPEIDDPNHVNLHFRINMASGLDLNFFVSGE